jgi:prepilin-type N-terminal cleavage/methylation domain-containing protein
MPQTKVNTRRKGFTLIELLIVILIVGIVYALGFSDIDMDTPQAKALSPLNLKSVLTSEENFKGQLSLLCINDCKSCFLRRSLSGDYTEYDSGIDLSQIKAYTINHNDNLIRIQYERYKDEPICLKMDFYPNGSSTQIILQDAENAYLLPSYFDEPMKFTDREEAKNHWLENARLVADNGEFY